MWSTALERTYLGYLRSSLAFAVLGIVIAQLFRLQHTAQPDLQIGFFVLGIPLACACISLGMTIALVGSYRFWRQQNAMARGKVYSGGWELNVVAAAGVVITLASFVLVLAVDVTKADA